MSTIKANDLQNSSGGIPTVKGQRLIPTAWVNFDGTGTVAIRDSENVSSITDNSTGYYTANFATTMDNADYSVVASCISSSGISESLAALTTSSVDIYLRANSDHTLADHSASITILGGQS